MRKKWNPGIRVFAGVVLTAAILSGCGSKTAGSGSAQNGGQNTEQNTITALMMDRRFFWNAGPFSITIINKRFHYIRRAL